MWHGRYYEDVSGQFKRKRKSIPIGLKDDMTKPEARRKLRAILEEKGINTSAHLERSLKPSQIFSSYADWWEKNIQPMHQPSSQNSSHYILKKHLRSRFGPIPMDSITEESVQEWIADLHSEGNLSALPTIERLKKLTQSLAMLDAVIEREWDYRFYSFNSNWATGEVMASMRNGQGDSWFCVFGTPGVFLKGFDHESVMSPWNKKPHNVWPGVLENIPEAFKTFATEPVFSMDDTTFCIWRGIHDTDWKAGSIAFPDVKDPDGSEWMLSILDGSPNTYKGWSEGHYEHSISFSAVQQIYKCRPLTAEVIRALNPNVDFPSILGDAAEIGYPVA
jgi:hypothetical protein